MLLGLSLVVAVAAAFIAFTTPKARPDNTASARKAVADARKANLATLAQANRATGSVLRRTWTGDPETIASRVMERLSKLAQERGVQLANFQVGRAIEAPSLIQTPFVVTLQGTFDNVMRTVRAIENPDYKLAVSGLRLEPAKSVGTEANSVSTTLSLTAFIHKENP
ncbi:hypothetical protein EON82_01805 [bacterium]|nr:MAG: hypothetical protein EON82_01805 [bacterium]